MAHVLFTDMSSNDREPTEHSSRSLRRFRPTKRGIVITGVLLLCALTLAIYVRKRSFQAKAERELTRIRSYGEPLTLADLERNYLDSVSAGNAAPDLQAAFQIRLARSKPADNRLWERILEGEWNDDIASVIQQILDDNTAPLLALERACQFRRAAHPLNWQGGFSMLVPHLANLKSLAEAAALRAMLLIHRGDTEGAVSSIEQIFSLAEQMQEEPLMVTQQVRKAICEMGFLSIGKVLNVAELSDSELRRLESRVRGSSSLQSYTKAVIGERAFGLQIFDNPQLLEGTPTTSGAALVWGGMRSAGILDYDRMRYLDTMRRGIELTKEPFPQALIESRVAVREFEEQVGQWRSWAHNGRFQVPKPAILTYMLAPVISKAVDNEARLLAGERLTLVGLEAERFERKHGFYPESLESVKMGAGESIDPYDGNQLRYSATATNFNIYSVGPNLKDDKGAPQVAPAEVINGVLVTPKKRAAFNKEYDIVLKVQRNAAPPKVENPHSPTQ